jgi:hypothetical protein
MKAKLRKDKDHYRLFVEDKQIGSTGTRVPSKEMYLLSFENCDSLFGIFDIEKLAEEYGSKFAHSYDPEDFIAGFNKAMELNKDKVFTLSNIRKAFNSLENHPNRTFTELVALLQPSEIEVEIEMREDYLMWKHSDIEKMSDCLVPKLDSEGCLILTKKI